MGFINLYSFLKENKRDQLSERGGQNEKWTKEEEIFDNKSEKWQESEAGDKNQEDRSTIEDAMNEIESAADTLGLIDEVASAD